MARTSSRTTSSVREKVVSGGVATKRRVHVSLNHNLQVHAEHDKWRAVRQRRLSLIREAGTRRREVRMKITPAPRFALRLGSAPLYQCGDASNAAPGALAPIRRVPARATPTTPIAGATTASTGSEAIKAARRRLVDHPLYAELTTTERVRVFMKYHAFAVWDFFSLLKRLQAEVTCVTVPWYPRGLGDHARFITEIVIAEECDEGPDGNYLSHFELYLTAMEEVEADTGPIKTFCQLIADGEPVEAAMVAPGIPDTAGDFVSHTLGVALRGAPHEVAACFCHGRENLLPDVFIGAREGMRPVLEASPLLAHYLDRHITLDHDEHGPLALRLLEAFCARDPMLEADAVRVGVEAIEARGRLWDGVLMEIDALPSGGA